MSDSDQSKQPLHRDVMELLWSAGEYKLVERRPADAPPVSGDYHETTMPHTDDECPFKDTDRVRFGEL